MLMLERTNLLKRYLSAKPPATDVLAAAICTPAKTSWSMCRCS